MHDEIWCLMKFSMRAIILTRNKHAEKRNKSIRAPSGLSLQLDPIKSQKNESCNLKKRPYRKTRLKTNSKFSPFVIK